jgi:hypothetical protein
LKQFRVALHILLHSYPVLTGDIHIINIIGENPGERLHVVTVPRICIFGENFPDGTFISGSAGLAKRQTVRHSDEHKQNAFHDDILCFATLQRTDGWREEKSNSSAPENRRVLVRLDHVASRIVNADHSIMGTTAVHRVTDCRSAVKSRARRPSVGVRRSHQDCELRVERAADKGSDYRWRTDDPGRPDLLRDDSNHHFRVSSSFA